MTLNYQDILTPMTADEQIPAPGAPVRRGE